MLQLLVTNNGNNPYYFIEDRKRESNRLREKYPDRIPIICEKDPNSKLEDLVKEK